MEAASSKVIIIFEINIDICIQDVQSYPYTIAILVVSVAKISVK